MSGEPLRITDYLAVYAAILSTLIFLWNFIQSRPRIKVDLIHGIEGTDVDPQFGIYIVVRNLSSHEVHLTGIDILYHYRKASFKEYLHDLWSYRRIPSRVGWVHSSLSNCSVTSGCPVSLGARASHQVFIGESTVENMLRDAIDRKLIACVQDQLWNNVYSRSFTSSTRAAK